MPQIIVNGKTYSSLDEMPPEIRQAYDQAMGILADKNHNGVPDILEGTSGVTNISFQTKPIEINSTQFIVDGKVYSSVAELPSEARQKYDQAMAKLGQFAGDANQTGISNLLKGAMPTDGRMAKTSLSQTALGTSEKISPHALPAFISNLKSPDRSIADLLIAALIGALLMLGAFLVLPLLK